MRKLGINPHTVLAIPDLIQQLALASSVGQAVDIVAGARYVSFGRDCQIVVNWGSTKANNVLVSAVAATGSTLVQEVNPDIRQIGSSLGTTGFSIISPTSGMVTAAWYQ